MKLKAKYFPNSRIFHNTIFKCQYLTVRNVTGIGFQYIYFLPFRLREILFCWRQYPLLTATFFIIF
jgi:hypothetical protein